MGFPTPGAGPEGGTPVPDSGATPADLAWLRRAVELSRRCPPTSTAYSVGAVVVAGNVLLAEGYSRDTGPTVHAEESALAKLAARPLTGLPPACLYTTLEPCTARASRPYTCTRLILEAGIPRVVLAMREPRLFVWCDGVRQLSQAGVVVVEVPQLRDAVLAANAHLLGDQSQ